MRNMKLSLLKFNCLNLLLGIALAPYSSAATAPHQGMLLPQDAPINFSYQGAFKFPMQTFGDSRLAFANGTFTLNPANNSVFIVGHKQHQAIGEFAIPELTNSSSLDDLATASNIQPFSSILLNGKRLKNTERLDYITGMEVIEGELFVNALTSYDASAKNKTTTFIVRNPSTLAKSDVDGMFKLQGSAHSAGWMSKLPKEWQSTFGASYLQGYASNLSINSRFSIGPTAFFSYLDAFAGVEATEKEIPARGYMDFSLKHPIVEDQYNKNGNNDIWTEISKAYYGFIPQGTNYYFIVGTSGGHESKMGYKITQTNGNLCGGPCAYDPADNYNYFWFFKVDDLVQVQQRNKQKWQILPSQYGKLSHPFAAKYGENLIAADYDEKRAQLYLLLETNYKEGNQNKQALVMLVYRLSV